MITRNATAALAAIFLVTISSQAEASRGDVSRNGIQQFCGDRYCGHIEPFKQVKKYTRIKPRSVKSSRGRSVASLKIKRFPALPLVLQKFSAPLGIVCAKPIAIGNNLLNSFKERIASIIEPVRKGYVSIETASGKKAVVADKAASKFVDFIRALEATGYRIKDIGGYAYRRIAHTRQLSKHAFGLAIDINQIERDVVSVPMNRKQVSSLASMTGICSGGDWRNGDLGHFEICGNRRHKHKRIRYAKAHS